MLFGAGHIVIYDIVWYMYYTYLYKMILYYMISFDIVSYEIILCWHWFLKKTSYASNNDKVAFVSEPELWCVWECAVSKGSREVQIKGVLP